jgi:hypothetical protein
LLIYQGSSKIKDKLSNYLISSNIVIFSKANQATLPISFFQESLINEDKRLK